ncbi:MAG: hypothetical protein C0423_21610 [Methylibium sp.]|nr:hypothetical protein [Methylibium sp.]
MMRFGEDFPFAERGRQAAAAGLTLIEMLVTLAIVSALVAMLSQGMSQLYRIERILESGQLSAQGEALRLEQLRIALEAALPASASSDDAMAGDASQLRFLTGDAPAVERPTFGQMEIQLQYDAGTQRTHLLLRSVADRGSRSGWVVQSWAGRSGRLQYVSHSGQLYESWPPAKAEVGTLPALVVIDPGVPDASVLITRLGVSRKPLRSKRELMTE